MRFDKGALKKGKRSVCVVIWRGFNETLFIIIITKCTIILLVKLMAISIIQ